MEPEHFSGILIDFPGTCRFRGRSVCVYSVCVWGVVGERCVLMGIGTVPDEGGWRGVQDFGC